MTLHGTPVEREAVRRLAEAVCFEKLTTCTVVGHTSTGRVRVVHAADPGPATATWRTLRESFS